MPTPPCVYSGACSNKLLTVFLRSICPLSVYYAEFQSLNLSGESSKRILFPPLQAPHFRNMEKGGCGYRTCHTSHSKHVVKLRMAAGLFAFILCEMPLPNSGAVVFLSLSSFPVLKLYWLLTGRMSKALRNAFEHDPREEINCYGDPVYLHI